jgi:hypothetical protein
MHESMDQESLKLLDESKRIEKVLFSSLHNQSYEHFHEINIGEVFESLPKRVFESLKQFPFPLWRTQTNKLLWNSN